MSARCLRVLLVGATGVFGSRLAEGLVREPSRPRIAGCSTPPTTARTGGLPSRWRSAPSQAMSVSTPQLSTSAPVWTRPSSAKRARAPSSASTRMTSTP